MLVPEPKASVAGADEGGTADLEPFFREAGTGPGVVCIHANASTSGQWRGLMELLAPRFRVFAPDSYGSGKSPSGLRTESSPSRRGRAHRAGARESRLAAGAGRPFIRRRGRAGRGPGESRAAYAQWPSTNRRCSRCSTRRCPRRTRQTESATRSPSASVALDAGNQDAAAERFIDYWMGAGTWKRTPEQRKPPIAASVTNMRRWGHALFTEPTPLQAFRSLDVPVLYMVGKRSTRVGSRGSAATGEVRCRESRSWSSRTLATWARLPILTRSMRLSGNFSNGPSLRFRQEWRTPYHRVR